METLRGESSLIVEKVRKLPEYQRAKHVALFMSMPREVQTIKLIEQAFVDGKEVFLPCVQGPERHQMTMFELGGMADLATFIKSKFGVPEPTSEYLEKQRKWTSEGVALDLIIVPGRAFTPSCHRLGWGKGYYDSFFATMAGSYREKGVSLPPLVGVAFDEQIVERIPLDPWDQPLDKLVTPSEVFEAVSSGDGDKALSHNPGDIDFLGGESKTSD